MFCPVRCLIVKNCEHLGEEGACCFLVCVLSVMLFLVVSLVDYILNCDSCMQYDQSLQNCMKNLRNIKKTRQGPVQIERLHRLNWVCALCI